MSEHTKDDQAVKDMIDRIGAEAEATKDDPMPEGTVWTRPNLARSVTFSLRLNPEELAEVQAVAHDRGIPASTLVRGWIVRQLAVERNAPSDTAMVVERLEADVRTLRKLVAS
jgi:hypothetical protein